MENFSARLKSLRGGLSKTDFSKKIGVSVKTYDHYESGRREPSLLFIVTVCHKLEISADWLLGLDEEPRNGVSLTATGSSVAANHSTVRTGAGVSSPAEVSRLLGIIESQQRVIESLASAKR